MDRASNEGGAWSFHALSRSGTLPAPPVFTKPPDPVVQGVCGGPSTWHERLSHWPVVTDSVSSPSPVPIVLGGGVCEIPNPLITWLVSLATNPHPEIAKGHFININSGVVGRGLQIL